MSSKTYFDNVATNWDTMRQGFFPDNLRDKALNAAGVQSGQIAADIGSGTGFLTAALVQAGLQVIAVDQSQAMLDQMRQNFADVDAIDYRVGESESLPITDASVDYVFANMYLHHVERPAVAIQEMVRILKPGGKLVITDLDEHTYEFLITEQHDRWMGFKHADIQSWFMDAGLTHVSINCTDDSCCSKSQTTDDEADISVFQAVGTKVGGQSNDIHTAVREHYGAIARSGGSCGCGDGTSCCSPADTISLDSVNVGSHAASLYGGQAIADLPFDVTGISLGCGDPVAIASLKSGETVLDLGSGGGIDCFLAAKQVGETGHVIGVDMTPDMLTKANANKAKMGVNNVEFRAGQIEALPVDTSTVDVVMSNCVINLSPDKAAVFHETFRVLKPGGRVSISDIVTEGAFTPEMRADASQWAACVSGAIDVEDYTALMRDAGFVDIQVVDKSDADDIISVRDGMPRIYSARITAYKPII